MTKAYLYLLAFLLFLCTSVRAQTDLEQRLFKLEDLQQAQRLGQ